MADITWSAYALAMFTPEERAAAAAVTYVPPETSKPLPVPPIGGQVGVVDSTNYSPIAGLDPNKPGDLQKIYAAGWRYEQGRWLNGTNGVAATPDQVLAGNGGRPPGLSSVSTVSSVAGGSVLGVSVPAAPAVMLPMWVGGAIGHVTRSGGTRPESGGTLRIIKGEGHKYSWTRVVR